MFFDRLGYSLADEKVLQLVEGPRLDCADLDRAYWASPRLASASPRLGLILIAELKSVIANSAEVALLKLLHTLVIILLKSQSSIDYC